MKKIFFIALQLFAFTALAQIKSEMELVWQDEFNNVGLPDAAKWDYEEGFIRNQEKQYYTKQQLKNCQVKNGFLTLTGVKERVANTFYQFNTTDWRYKDSLAFYSSASINTKSKFNFTYGRVEVKAKLPKGNGIWPAIWMLGVDKTVGGWLHIGEIDIMEFIGNEPHHIYGTIHYADSLTGKHASKGSRIVVKDLHSNFHVYAMEWDEKKIDIFFDDSLYHRVYIDSLSTVAKSPFRKPFYILLNLALGGAWPGPIDDAVLPQQFVIDYIRVYQKKILKQ